MSASGEGAGPAEGDFLSPEQLRDLDDDAFFEAYQAGRVQRRGDALTEDNWEEVRVYTPRSLPMPGLRQLRVQTAHHMTTFQ